jgi:hypothetical protein
MLLAGDKPTRVWWASQARKLLNMAPNTLLTGTPMAGARPRWPVMNDTKEGSSRRY